jgi:uncharacterized protein involved in type VI secretion and phage assembly
MKPFAVIPKIVLTLGGSDVRPEDLRYLSYLRVFQSLSRPTLFEAAFSGTDSGFHERYPCKRTSPLAVRLADEALPLFTGIVTAVEHRFGPSGEARLAVRGYDRLYLAGKRQRTHTHIQTTVAEIAGDMVREYGIGVIPHGEAGPVWHQLVQYNETDLDFLARTAQRSGLYVFLNRENRLSVMSLAGTGDTVDLTLGDNLFELTLEDNDAPALASVYASGWDPFLAEFHDGKADGGADDGQERRLLDIPLRNSDEADAVTRSEQDRCAAHEATARGVADGTPQLAPGVTLRVGGVDSRLSSDYVITEVDHTFSPDSGYVSEFATVPPDFRKPDAGVSGTFGFVTDIGDPENLGRIKAVLPTFENIETEWMNVLMPAAGKNKGTVMLPDTGDQVLILFLNNDPARGVVIGSVYGSGQQPPDWGIDKNTVSRFTFLTPGGQRITLDDTADGIRLENRKGSCIELYPDTVTLRAETRLIIEAPDNRITIRGKAIDFEKG